MEKIKDRLANSDGQPRLQKDTAMASILATDCGDPSSAPPALTSRHKADPTRAQFIAGTVTFKHL